MKNIHKNKKIPLKIKINTLETCTLPVLTYGAQTWALTKNQLDKMRTTQRAMERSILNIKKAEKIKIAQIRGRTKMKDIGYTIKRLKFNYAGHMQGQRRGGGTTSYTNGHHMGQKEDEVGQKLDGKKEGIGREYSGKGAFKTGVIGVNPAEIKM